MSFPTASTETKDGTDPYGARLASALFDQFCNANTMQGIMDVFQQMCTVLDLQVDDHANFYRRIRTKLKSWKAQSLWAKLDKRASNREYKKGTACANTRVLVIGAGPCGLRTAIEVALLGGKVVVVEKRDRFSRNNVLHLWPFLIHDLKALGAKKFFGKFCAGAIDHISIRALQCILLKVALLLGVEIHPGVAFDCIREPDEGHGWRAWVVPEHHPVSEYEYDVLVGADGKRNTLPGFKRKEFRGKLAIAITANFINRNTQAEARVEEISGVAFIFNQKFFKDLYAKTGIDLENIVYYKDETHYFVMTAKKHSLLKKGVLIQDYGETEQLLSRENVNQEKLFEYAKEAADFSTNHQLPVLEFAHNHAGQADIAMFDFTSLFAAEYSSRIVDKKGYKLLMNLVGDSLLEPFWPTGSGCARGFLGALDTAWMIRNLASDKSTPLEVLAERESVYQLLSQCTPENMNKNYSRYTVDPNSRYPNLNSKFFKPHQMRLLYESDNQEYLDKIVQVSEERNKRYERIRDYHYLLKWFQKQLDPYQNLVKVLDLTTSWKSGIALCALIHKFHPGLLDVYKLDPNEVGRNNQLAFDIAEKEFNIAPVMTGEEMAMSETIEQLIFISYLSQFYELFKKHCLNLSKELLVVSDKPHSVPQDLPTGKVNAKINTGKKVKLRHRHHHDAQRRSGGMYSSSDEDSESENVGKELLKRQISKDCEQTGSFKKKIKDITLNLKPSVEQKYADIDTKLEAAKRHLQTGNIGNLDTGTRGKNKVSELAKELGDRFEGLHKPRPLSARKLDPKPLIMGHSASADSCYFCKKKVYLMERQHAEGVYFHRWCLKCDFCGTALRIGSYLFLRTDDGTAKFFCYQHYGLRRKKIGKLGKRQWGDRQVNVDEEKMKIQKSHIQGKSVITEKDRQVLYEADELPPIKIKVPKSRKSSNFSSIDITDSLPSPSSSVELNKTPERIEFENVVDGAEESEFEQTAHNLSSSCLDLLDSDEDSDSDEESSEDEYSFSDDDDGGDPDLGFAAYENSCRCAEKLHGRKYEANSDDADDETETETETAGESNEGWESDTETEKESDEAQTESTGNRDHLHLKSNFSPSPQETKPSPTSLLMLKNRMSFFSETPQVVRIDANKLFGIKNENVDQPAEDPEDNEPIEENTQYEKDEVCESTVQDISAEKFLVDEDNNNNTGTETAVTTKSAIKSETDIQTNGEVDMYQDFDEFDPTETSKTESIVENITNEILDDTNSDIEISSDEDIEESVKLLFERESSDVYSSSNLEGKSALHMDSINDDHEIVDMAPVSEVEGSCIQSSTLEAEVEKTCQEVSNDYKEASEYDQNITELSIANATKPEVALNTTGDVAFNHELCHRREIEISDVKTDVNVQMSEIENVSASKPIFDLPIMSQNSNRDKDYVYDYKDLTREEQPPLALSDDFDIGIDTPMRENQTCSLTEYESVEHIEEHSKTSIVVNKDTEFGNPLQNQADKTVCCGNSEEGSVREHVENMLSLHDADEREASIDSSLNAGLEPVKKKFTSEEIPVTNNKENAVLDAHIDTHDALSELINSDDQAKEESEILGNNHYLDMLESDSSSLDKSEGSECIIPTVVTKLEYQMSNSSSDANINNSSTENRVCTSDTTDENTDTIDDTYISEIIDLETNTIGILDNQSIQSAPAEIENTDTKKKSEYFVSSPLDSLSLNQGNITEKKSSSVPVQSSGNKQLENAKKKFFSEAPQPLRIDPHTAFSNENKKIVFNNSTDICQTREKPHFNVAKECFAHQIGQDTNAFICDRSKHDYAVTRPQEFNTSIKTLNERKKTNTEPMHTEKDVKRNTAHDVYDREKAREKARDRAKMLSDEELGIDQATQRPTLREKTVKPSDSVDNKDGDEKKRRSFLGLFLSSKSDKKDSKLEKKDKSKRSNTKSEKVLTKGKSVVKEKNSIKEKEASKLKSGPVFHGLPMPAFSNRKGTTVTSPLATYLATVKNELPSGGTYVESEEMRNFSEEQISAPKASLDECVITDVDSEFDDTASICSYKSQVDVQKSDKHAKRMQKAALRQHRRAEQKRLRMAQEIQRHLEEIEIKMQSVEERGILIESKLQGSENTAETEMELMGQWFNIVHEKNALVRYQSELMVHARELELEDRQARLQQKLRDQISHEETVQTPDQRKQERTILEELLDVVEQRDVLVAMLEKDRVRAKEEDRDLEEMMLNKGFQLSPLSYKLRLPSMHDLESSS